MRTIPVALPRKQALPARQASKGQTQSVNKPCLPFNTGEYVRQKRPNAEHGPCLPGVACARMATDCYGDSEDDGADDDDEADDYDDDDDDSADDEDDDDADDA